MRLSPHDTAVVHSPDLLQATVQLSAFRSMTPSLTAFSASARAMAGSALLMRMAMRSLSELANFRHLSKSPL